MPLDYFGADGLSSPVTRQKDQVVEACAADAVDEPTPRRLCVHAEEAGPPLHRAIGLVRWRVTCFLAPHHEAWRQIVVCCGVDTLGEVVLALQLCEREENGQQHVDDE